MRRLCHIKTLEHRGRSSVVGAPWSEPPLETPLNVLADPAREASPRGWAHRGRLCVFPSPSRVWGRNAQRAGAAEVRTLPSRIRILIFESAPFHDEKVSNGLDRGRLCFPVEPGAALRAKWGPGARTRILRSRRPPPPGRLIRPVPSDGPENVRAGVCRPAAPREALLQVSGPAGAGRSLGVTASRA